MDWRIKGVIQGVLSRVPGGVALNDALQRAAGGRRDESRHIDIKFEADWLVQMRVLDDLGLRSVSELPPLEHISQTLELNHET